MANLGPRSAKEVDVIIGQRIRQFRKIKGISQTTLGDHCGISFQQIQKYELGHNRVGASRLVQIADRLGVSAEFFFKDLSKHDASEMPSEMKYHNTNSAIEMSKALHKLTATQQAGILKLARTLA